MIGLNHLMHVCFLATALTNQGLASCGYVFFRGVSFDGWKFDGRLIESRERERGNACWASRTGAVHVMMNRIPMSR